jgi:hypothetical protein
MTPRVQAGCRAAVANALEHADDPGVLKATLQIGKLEGIWVTFFARREQTGTKQVAAARLGCTGNKRYCVAEPDKVSLWHSEGIGCCL